MNPVYCWGMLGLGMVIGALIGIFVVALCTVNRTSRELEALGIAHNALTQLAEGSVRAKGYLAAFLSALGPEAMELGPYSAHDLTLAVITGTMSWLAHWDSMRHDREWVEYLLNRVEAQFGMDHVHAMSVER